jgi:hypothetical protein
MMKQFVVLPLILLLSFSGRAQILIVGKILDAESQEALPYVSIFLKENSVATISNADGEFSLVIADSFATDTLAIAAMGYASYRIRVGDIDQPQTMLVRLKLKPIPLDEIVVRESKISAGDIVRSAFEQIENNFPTVPYKLNGFFREMWLEDDRCVQLIEAAIDVHDMGYAGVRGSRPNSREKVDLKSVRTSNNYRHACFKNSAVERYNLVVGGLTHNPVRYRQLNTSQWMRDKKFTTDSVVYFNERPVYVVSFLSYLRQYPNFERKNTLYIDAENYSIYKYMSYEYPRKGKYSEKPRPLAKESVYLINRKQILTTYEYGRYKGKMYLKYFDERCFDDIVNSTDGSVVFESFGHITLIIGHIETENVVFPAVETIKRGQNLATQITAYDPVFWKNFEQVKMVPLTRKNIQDLEREMPLEKQFKNQYPRQQPDTLRNAKQAPRKRMRKSNSNQ